MAARSCYQLPRAAAPMCAPHMTSWSAEAAKGAAAGTGLLLASQLPHQREAALSELRRSRSTLLGQPAEMRALLTDPDERAPPTRIPEEWHIRLSLSERPATLDEMGGRFLWTAEREGACGRTRGGWPVAGGTAAAAASSASSHGTLTVFPMAEPHGALDIEVCSTGRSPPSPSPSPPIPRSRSRSTVAFALFSTQMLEQWVREMLVASSLEHDADEHTCR